MPYIGKTNFAVSLIYGAVLLIFGVNGWRPYKIVITDHLEEIYSAKCRANASFTDSGKFNLYVEFLNNIRSPFMHTGLYFESENGKYEMEVLNRTVDLCKFYKYRRYEPILKGIFKLFEDYLSHWFTSCPTNKGVYYLKNVELNVEKLPPFFPEKSGMFDGVVFDKQERLFRIKVSFRILKTFQRNKDSKEIRS